MKRYAVFLRGVNVGGKNRIPMPEFRAGLEALGFFDVKTILNSGNAVFSAGGGDPRPLIERMIAEKFGMQICAYVIPAEELQKILSDAPGWWDTGDKELYDTLIFLLTDDPPAEIFDALGEPSPGLERAEMRGNVIFWTYRRKEFRRCSWQKTTSAAGISEKLAVRTAATVRKACL